VKKAISTFAFAAVLVASASIALAAPQGGVGETSMTVILWAQNASGEHGTATLSKYLGNKTKVVINVVHAPGGADQPAHIHTGSCGVLLGGVKTPLANVVHPGLGFGPGSSTIILNEPFSDFSSGTGKLAINVHKSSAPGPGGIGHYMACGNLPQ
jgi:hypothetical protein